VAPGNITFDIVNRFADNVRACIDAGAHDVDRYH
jgi:hypothetical protein